MNKSKKSKGSPVSKKAKPVIKPVKIILPIPSDHPLESALVEPVALPADHPHEPLAAPVEGVRCIATNVPTWLGYNRIILTAKDGHELPAVSESGTEVLVTFSPPANPN